MHVHTSTALTAGVARFQYNGDNNYEVIRVESLGNYDAHIGFFADGDTNYYGGFGIDYSDAGKFKLQTDNLFAGGSTLMTWARDGKVGIGTTSPQAQLDLTVPNAKTANASVYSYLGKTNESSGYGALQLFQIGHANAASRQWQFQTIEQGVANAGIITFQLSGGQVAIGRSTADTKLDVTGDIRASTGIKFGSDTAAANALDDYEEGNFTPTFVASGGTAPSGQVGTGQYTKIGDVVHITGQITWTGAGSGGSNMYIALPFTVLSDARAGIAIGLNSGIQHSANHQLYLIPEINNTSMYLIEVQPDSAGHTHLNYGHVVTSASDIFSFSGCYHTSA